MFNVKQQTIEQKGQLFKRHNFMPKTFLKEFFFAVKYTATPYSGLQRIIWGTSPKHRGQNFISSRPMKSVSRVGAWPFFNLSSPDDANMQLELQTTVLSHLAPAASVGMVLSPTHMVVVHLSLLIG